MKVFFVYYFIFALHISTTYAHDGIFQNNVFDINKRYENSISESATCGSRQVENSNGDITLHIQFPKVVPNHDDQYLCTSFPVPYNEEESFITKYIPHASMNASHHMLVYGCELPGVQKAHFWDCAAMGRICGTKRQSIVYAWAKDAPSLNLPPHIGYRIGGNTGIHFLVVQIHYAHKLKAGHYDCSGFSAIVTQKPQLYYAGIYLLGASFINIAPMRNFSKADISCENTASSPLHVFAFRTHAHSLAKVITGYRVRNLSSTMIGKGNPQWPQAFYPRVGGSIELVKGDILLSRCVYQSNRKTIVHAGLKGSDEMCNFYMMYYSKHGAGDLECWGDQLAYKNLPFPRTADSLAPYPGYAGNDSTAAILHGNAVLPSIPKQHIHHEDKHFEEELHNTTPMNKGHLIFDGSWPVYPSLGQVGGVAVDSSGYLHVFHRGDRVWDQYSFNPTTNMFSDSAHPIMMDTVIVINPNTGSIVGQWGKKMFYMPHGISIDGQDNIWLTDVAMHQVFKFSSNDTQKPLLTLGQKMVPGNSKTHFCKPADVVVDTDGYIYVADGYCNNRVVKFDYHGRFIRSWGEHEVKTREGSWSSSVFNLPHSITLATQHVCVADRENGRIQCFDKEGKFYKMIEHKALMGPNVYAIAYTNTNGGLLYAVNGLSGREGKTCGFTIEYNSGRILQEWCPIKQMTRPHDVAVSGDNVYVGQLNGLKVLKFTNLKAFNNASKQLNETRKFEGDAEESTPLGEDNDWPILVLIALLVLPILAAIVACLIVRRRAKQYDKYQGYRSTFVY